MKLLKFLNCDAPSVAPSALKIHPDENRLSVSHPNGPDAIPARSWRLLPQSPSTHHCYWLLHDDHTPIGPIHDVLLATEAETRGGAPNGINAAHTAGVDLRSKMGRQLQQRRAEYGQMFKTSAKNAALMMDAERLKAARDDRVKRERERVVETIENGEESARHVRRKREEETTDQTARKRGSGEGKSRRK